MNNYDTQGLAKPIHAPLNHPPRAGVVNVNLWTPAAFGADLAVWYEPADRATLFTDIAKTALAMNEGDAIAVMADKSGNGYDAKKITVSARPLLYYLLGSFRRAVNFDGVDDVLTATIPDLGTHCTVGRAIPGTGAVIATEQSLSTTFNHAIDHAGMVIVKRALTAAETAKLTAWLNEKAGVLDQYNVPYGPAGAESVNIYRASGHPKGPVIVMVHGGGWRNGDKAISNVVENKALHWLPKGFTIVSVGYTLDVGTDPIDQARAAARALAWTQAHATEWGCNPNEIVLMGHSAGGHLVALVSSSLAMRNAAGVRPWRCTVGLDTAAYNVRQIMESAHPSLYDEPWGVDPTHWDNGSPTQQLTVTPPPFLLVVSTEGGGEGDSINGGAYRDAVIARGGTASIYETPLLHGEVNDLLGVPGAYTDSVDVFLASVGL